MVVFVDGKPAKDFYRKFRIKSKDTPDDFAMMEEVLRRRLEKLPIINYQLPMKNTSTLSPPNLGGEDFERSEKSEGAKKVDESFSVCPDLIIVDGGKGQLSSAYKILKEYEFGERIPVVGLAKREEEIFKIYDNTVGASYEFAKVRLPRRSEALYLIQRIRDEAHRFAIGYHRKLRSSKSVHSLLDDIPGVGKVTKKRLLKAYGSVESIKRASKANLESIVRNKRTLNALVKVLRVER
jgi:excinuclease ABC subunit C